MEKVDVVKFAYLSGKTERYIRRLCEEEKLPHQEQPIATGKGKKYFVYLATDEAKKLIIPERLKEYLEEQYRNRQVPEPEQYKNSKSYNDDIIESHTVPEQTITTGTLNIIEELIRAKDEIIKVQQKTLEYAEQAGQVKLLTDNNKFYQEEYFKVKYEKDELQKKYEELQTKYSELEIKLNSIEDTKSRKWWLPLKKQ